MSFFIRRIFPVLFFCLLLASSRGVHAGSPDPFGIGHLIGSRDAVLVTDPGGKIIFSKNAERKMVTASALKIFTALAALHHLGPDYRFFTEFYQDDDNNLVIKGYGDPLLISEGVKKIAEQLIRRVPNVTDIVLDDTFFAKPIDIPGASTLSRDPYNAPNGALCVNFNTVLFNRVNGVPVSAEPQTPLLPLALKRIRAGKLDAGRITFSFDGDEITTYAGELFVHYFREAGMTIKGRLRLDRVDMSKDRLIYRYQSEYFITDIIERLLKYSNNYIANQLLISVGAAVYGPPGTLEKGVTAAKQYSADILGIRDLELAEGSGLSRENRVSAAVFLKILDAFAPYHALMPFEGGDYYKTGTLTGVRARVGFIRAGDGSLYRYVILLNTPEKTVDPIIRRIKISIDK